MSSNQEEKPAAEMDEAIKQKIIHEMEEAHLKAIDSLSRYKFVMFGYWAAIWVHLNRLGGFGQPNPFHDLVETARNQRDKKPEPKAPNPMDGKIDWLRQYREKTGANLQEALRAWETDRNPPKQDPTDTDKEPEDAIPGK